MRIGPVLWVFAAVGVIHVVADVGVIHVVATVGKIVVADCDKIQTAVIVVGGIGIAVNFDDVADEVVVFVVRLVAAAERNDLVRQDVGCRLDNQMNLQPMTIVYPSHQLDGVSLTFEHHLVNFNDGDHCY